MRRVDEQDRIAEAIKDLFEPHDLVMVLEPLNGHANHGGVFLERSDQAYALGETVDSPACKILFDTYHQQTTEGNLIPNIDLSRDETDYFEIGGNWGRKEPGTGEINYRSIFKHIHDRMKAEVRDFMKNRSVIEDVLSFLESGEFSKR